MTKRSTNALIVDLNPTLPLVQFFVQTNYAEKKSAINLKNVHFAGHPCIKETVQLPNY